MVDPFEPIFKGMFAAGFEAVDRMRGVPVWRAEDAKQEAPDANPECPKSTSGHSWCQATTTTEECVFCDLERPFT